MYLLGEGPVLFGSLALSGPIPIWFLNFPMWPIPFHHLLLFSGFSPVMPWSSAVTSHLGTALPVEYHMTQSGLRSVYKPPIPSPFSFLRFELVEYFATVASHPPLLLLLLLALLSLQSRLLYL